LTGGIGRHGEFIHVLSGLGAIDRSLRLVVAGDIIVSKTEQHVRINDSNLVPPQQHTGNRIACQYLPRREKMESGRVSCGAGMQL
jgi:hypothetical protein